MTASDIFLRAALCGIAVSMLVSGATVRVRVSIGQSAAKATPFYIRFLPSSPSSKIERLQTVTTEGSNAVSDGAWTGSAGAGTAASVTFDLVYRSDSTNNSHPLDIMWADLIKHSDADTAARLSHDAAYEAGASAVKV